MGVKPATCLDASAEESRGGSEYLVLVDHNGIVGAHVPIEMQM